MFGPELIPLYISDSVSGISVTHHIIYYLTNRLGIIIRLLVDQMR